MEPREIALMDQVNAANWEYICEVMEVIRGMSPQEANVLLLNALKDCSPVFESNYHNLFAYTLVKLAEVKGMLSV